MPENLPTQVFWAVAQAGALTTRRVIRQFGPKPNWEAALRQRYLREMQSTYGPVLTVGDVARKLIQARPPPPEKGLIPYVAGPSAVADRAFLMDALEALAAQGYTVARHDYKKAGTVGNAARRGAKVTHQIIRTVMKVPETRMSWQAADGKPYGPDHYGIYPETPGYPLLYATISNGGIKLPRLQKLYKRHKRDIARWATPLLIAVPEEGDLGAYIRAVEAAQRAVEDSILRRGISYSPSTHRLIELVILPLPKTS
jgi:hypothetical protein